MLSSPGPQTYNKQIVAIALSLFKLVNEGLNCYHMSPGPQPQTAGFYMLWIIEEALSL